MYKFSIIIPCYNEADNIFNLIKRIKPLQRKFDIQYILVENGSRDKSREIFKTKVESRIPGISVVYVDENRGYGYGLQQGMKAADGEYVGWIHADLQMPPENLIPFFNEAKKHSSKEKLFLKGIRINRSTFDQFFTNGQSIFNSLYFGMRIYDVGAIPVIFSKSLLEDVNIDDMPNDFSVELYVYREALRLHYTVLRHKVKLLNREKGNSSWNHGFKSKMRQSRIIFIDSLKIKRGEKVL